MLPQSAGSVWIPRSNFPFALRSKPAVTTDGAREMKSRLMPAALMPATLLFGGLTTPLHAGHASSAFAAHHGHLMSQTMPAGPARLGVAISDVPQAELDLLSLEYGVRVDRVMSGSVALEGGIEAGDIVTAIDGRPVYSPQRMQFLVGESGSRSSIELLRDGRQRELQLSYAAAGSAGAVGKAVLGVRIQEMTADLKDAFGTQGEEGVLVSQVMPESAAGRAGLKAGDVLVSIGGRSVAAVRDVRSILHGQRPGDRLEVGILRDREAVSLQVALDAHPVLPHTGHRRAGRHHDHAGKGRMPGKYCHKADGQRRS
jgi:C-terminal processing protease CtpA/Prc